MRRESLMVRHVPPNGRSQTPHSGGWRDREAPKSKRDQKMRKKGKGREERKANRRETAGKEREKGNGKKERNGNQEGENRHQL